MPILLRKNGSISSGLPSGRIIFLQPLVWNFPPQKLQFTALPSGPSKNVFFIIILYIWLLCKFSVLADKWKTHHEYWGQTYGSYSFNAFYHSFKNVRVLVLVMTSSFFNTCISLLIDGVQSTYLLFHMYISTSLGILFMHNISS